MVVCTICSHACTSHQKLGSPLVLAQFSEREDPLVNEALCNPLGNGWAGQVGVSSRFPWTTSHSLTLRSLAWGWGDLTTHLFVDHQLAG